MPAEKSYTIRSAHNEDLPTLRTIEQAAAQLFRATPYAWIGDDDGMSLADLDHWLTSGKIWVVVDAGDTPVGFAIARAVDNTAYLHEIDIHPQHGRQGLGTHLIEAVMAWARENDYLTVTLSTFSDVPWNAPYYQRLGFHILEEAALGPGLQEVRAHEAATGLPIERRVCMARAVTPLSWEQVITHIGTNHNLGNIT